MRLTDKDKIKELMTLKKSDVLMSENEYKELKLGKLEDILEKYAITDLEQLDRRLDESVRDFTYLGYGERKVKDYYDIEQELGIDLITLFKAIKNGIAFKMPRSKNIEFSKSCFLETETLTIHPQYSTIFTFGLHLDFKDYGKTWALTKEELL